jgi:HTH-type transcriptional regulator/antitoxin HigA
LKITTEAVNTRTPAEVFPPGEFIRDELEARGWTQDDLAQIMGRPQTAINLIINDKRGISPETATELGGAFGTSPEFWLNLDSAYRLSKVLVPVAEIRQRASLFAARNPNSAQTPGRTTLPIRNRKAPPRSQKAAPHSP